MPALSPTMTDGKIAIWLKEEGEKIDVGDLLCDITTDKATVGLESQEEGYLAKIMRPAGPDAIELGALIGLIVEEEEDIKEVDVGKYEAAAAAAPKEAEP